MRQTKQLTEMKFIRNMQKKNLRESKFSSLKSICCLLKKVFLVIEKDQYLIGIRCNFSHKDLQEIEIEVKCASMKYRKKFGVKFFLQNFKIHHFSTFLLEKILSLSVCTGKPTSVAQAMWQNFYHFRLPVCVKLIIFKIFPKWRWKFLNYVHEQPLHPITFS